MRDTAMSTDRWSAEQICRGRRPSVDSGASNRSSVHRSVFPARSERRLRSSEVRRKRSTFGRRATRARGQQLDGRSTAAVLPSTSRRDRRRRACDAIGDQSATQSRNNWTVYDAYFQPRLPQQSVTKLDLFAGRWKHPIDCWKSIQGKRN